MHVSSGNLKLKQNIACKTKGKQQLQGHKDRIITVNQNNTNAVLQRGRVYWACTLFGATSLTLWNTELCILAPRADSATCKSTNWDHQRHTSKCRLAELKAKGWK